MKKFSAFTVIVAFLIVPLVCSAKTLVSENDLGEIFAQTGDITITFDDITVKDRILRTTSIDGLDFWNPNYNPTDGNYGHADYYVEADPTPNNSDYENNMAGEGHIWAQYPNKGYLGYEARLTGGQVRRSGEMILEVFNPENDPSGFNYSNVYSDCRLYVQMVNQRIEADIAVEMVIKLSPNQDLSGGGTLGRTYTSGVSMTNNGNLSVYAHNTPWTPSL
jgi:hypothetical protein